jgi:hypothetical protein
MLYFLILIMIFLGVYFLCFVTIIIGIIVFSCFGCNHRCYGCISRLFYFYVVFFYFVFLFLGSNRMFRGYLIVGFTCDGRLRLLKMLC